MTVQRKFDPDNAALFIANYREALRAAHSLAVSVKRTAGLFPLDAHAMKALDEDASEKLDAFRIRFAGLQDLLASKLFRGILLLEEEMPQSMLDILNAMEKRGVITSFDNWKRSRDLRNAFIPDCPLVPNQLLPPCRGKVRMGVEQWKNSVSTPSQALPLQGGGDISANGLSGFMHEYPDQLDICAAALTGAHAVAGELIHVLMRVRERAIDHVGLDSGDLPDVS